MSPPIRSVGFVWSEVWAATGSTAASPITECRRLDVDLRQHVDGKPTISRSKQPLAHGSSNISTKTSLDGRQMRSGYAIVAANQAIGLLQGARNQQVVSAAMGEEGKSC